MLCCNCIKTNFRAQYSNVLKMKQWLSYNIDKIYSFHKQILKTDFRCDIIIAAQAIAGMPLVK